MESHSSGTTQEDSSTCFPAQSTSKPRQRRLKVSVPETEKDARYWDKRKRNNIAARRSREVKRQQNENIKESVSFLKEENSFLKSQLAILKKRCSIPLNQVLEDHSEHSLISYDDVTFGYISSCREDRYHVKSGEDDDSLNDSGHCDGFDVTESQKQYQEHSLMRGRPHDNAVANSFHSSNFNNLSPWRCENLNTRIERFMEYSTYVQAYNSAVETRYNSRNVGEVVKGSCDLIATDLSMKKNREVIGAPEIRPHANGKNTTDYVHKRSHLMEFLRTPLNKLVSPVSPREHNRDIPQDSGRPIELVGLNDGANQTLVQSRFSELPGKLKL